MDDGDNEINLNQTSHEFSIQKTEKYVRDHQKDLDFNAPLSEEQNTSAEFHDQNLHNSSDIVPSTSANCFAPDKTKEANENVVYVQIFLLFSHDWNIYIYMFS